uniref:Uncharacterized protein n=1 Tax=Solanum tuberosum TaxID=4113 RepID=M0ZX04_SOLTU
MTYMSEKLKYRAGNRVLGFRKAENRLTYLPYTSIYSQKISYTRKKRENTGGRRKNTKFKQNYRSGSSRISDIHGVYIEYTLSVYHDQ